MSRGVNAHDSQGASFSSSNLAVRSDGVLEYWSSAPSPNRTRVAGTDAEGEPDFPRGRATRTSPASPDSWILAPSSFFGHAFFWRDVALKAKIH